MSSFKEDFHELCREDLKAACLIALSVLSLRHISEEDKYSDIRSVLVSVEIDNVEINKIKKIYSVVGSYDSKIISIMSEIENKIVNLIYNGEGETKSKIIDNSFNHVPEIKKWWEVQDGEV